MNGVLLGPHGGQCQLGGRPEAAGMPLEIEGLWGRRRASWVKGFGSRFVMGPVPTDQRTDSSAPGVPPVMMRYKIHRTWYCGTRLVSPRTGLGNEWVCGLHRARAPRASPN